MLPVFLYASAVALIAAGMVALALGRIATHRAYGVMAVSQVLTCAAGFLQGYTTAASISAAAAGLLAWQWWNGGGGDDTKRRLGAWVRSFRGVRRTAPAGAE